MNIYTTIKEILTAIKSTAVVHVYNRTKAEAETQNYEGQVVLIHTDYTTEIDRLRSGALRNYTIFTIDFLDRDEWDNVDNDELDVSDEASFDIIERMELLTNSVFSFWFFSEDFYFPDALQRKWTFTPLWRVTSNFMTGTRAVIKVPFITDVKCDFS